MRFDIMTKESPGWRGMMAYAKLCPWSAGPYLAKEMENDAFTDWERVIGAWDGDTPCGFCTVTKADCIPDAPYTPYIGFVYVDEAYRGHRLSEQMIRAAMDYLKTVGFSKVYLVSDHVGLYEKYGFRAIDQAFSPSVNGTETIFVQEF